MGPRAQQLVEKADLSSVFSAVNAIQGTSYRINKYIYRHMREAMDAGYPLFKVKTGDSGLKNRIKGLQKMMAFRLSLCERLLEEQIYFPHQLDHRGRAYPVPQLMNPQSDDNGRPLLELAEGKPLGESGAYWLGIHLANCYWRGKKVSFNKLLEWVQKNEKEIIAFAENPLPTHRFWKEAKKPWALLAACDEWRGYKEQGRDFVSHLPISMDGTCNGYQHLSAMGRDPIGGRATNLVPADKPEDIYQWVADLISRRIERDAKGGGADADAARQLLGKIDRNTVKSPTMTTPYGVSEWTICESLRDEAPVKDCADPLKCARYLAKLLVEYIPQVGVQAGAIMNWLQNVARALAEANRSMAWTTSTGLVVVHAVRKPKPVRIKTADHKLLIYKEDETRKIVPRKQMDGITAHLVHSFDAAHMMRTVNRLHAEGIRHFVMVHDSYGVHAADIDTLNRILREEFVGIYSEPVLKNFLNELRKANPGVKLSDPPPLGTLDIQQVLRSPYFFA